MDLAATRTSQQRSDKRAPRFQRHPRCCCCRECWYWLALLLLPQKFWRIFWEGEVHRHYFTCDSWSVLETI
jgi:hypothetical protein